MYLLTGFLANDDDLKSGAPCADVSDFLFLFLQTASVLRLDVPRRRYEAVLTVACCSWPRNKDFEAVQTSTHHSPL